MTTPRTRQPSRKEIPGAPWEALVAELLTGRPALEGASCVGRSDLFDPADPDEDPNDTSYRHQAAHRICMGCPALTECSDWAEPARGQVLGGRIPKSTRLTVREEVA